MAEGYEIVGLSNIEYQPLADGTEFAPEKDSLGYVPVITGDPNSAGTGAVSYNAVSVLGVLGNFGIYEDRIQLGTSTNTAGVSGNVTTSDDVRFWAGNTFANRDTAPFRVTESGALVATSATISGTLTAAAIHIPDEDTTDNSFHVNSGGNTWWGATTSDFDSDNDNANAYVLSDGQAKFANILLSGVRSGSIILPTPTDDNLAGYWSFDEGQGAFAIDETANANHGAITTATHAQGISGTCLTFNGASGSVLVSDNSAIQNIWDAGGGVSLWFNANSDGEFSGGKLINKSTGWSVFTRDELASLLRIRFSVDFDSTDGVWETDRIVSINGWHHFFIGYDADSVSNDPTFVLDSVSTTVNEITAPVGTRVTDVGSDLYFGSNAAGDRTFDGELDEIRLYTSEPTLQEAISLRENPAGNTPQGVKQLGGRYFSAASGAVVQIFPTNNIGFLAQDSSGNDVFKVEVGGTDVGDVTLGDPTSGAFIRWDSSLSTLEVRANLVGISNPMSLNVTIQDIASTALNEDASFIGSNAAGDITFHYNMDTAGTNASALFRIGYDNGSFYLFEKYNEGGYTNEATFGAGDFISVTDFGGSKLISHYDSSLAANVFFKESFSSTSGAWGALTISGTASSGQITTDDTDVYVLDYSDDVTVRRYTISGSTITYQDSFTLANASPDGFTYDGTLWWGRSAGVIRSFNGSGVVQGTITLSNTPLNLFRGVVVRDSRVYICSYMHTPLGGANRTDPTPLQITLVPVGYS